MKNNFILLACLMVVACGSNKSSTSNEKSNLVTQYLDNNKSITKVEGDNPINQFSELAKQMADKTLKLKKDNIENVLKQISNFKYCVVVTENHTIASIISTEDCSQSGAWNACMPKANGYIKKGDFEHIKDYLNNIIGVPDNQIRMVYFFN